MKLKRMEHFCEKFGFLKPLITDCAAVYKYYERSLNDFSRVVEKESEMKKLAGNKFVECFRVIVKEICVMHPDSNTETYLYYANTAMEMLTSGVDQDNVLLYLEKKLIELHGG